MARVEIARSAISDLRSLVVSHSLPPTTARRVADSLRPLQDFPLMGRRLGGDWEDLRCVLGPWRWLLVVYLYETERERVVVVTFQDARSSAAATPR